jgi:ligand-binding sensor domain-containing protein
MKTTIYLATDRGLTVIVGGDGNWRGKVCLEDKQVQCVVADSKKRGSVYCGTFGDGLFTSETGGATWERSASFTEPNVMAVASSRSGSLYVGTELSACSRVKTGGVESNPEFSIVALRGPSIAPKMAA